MSVATDREGDPGLGGTSTNSLLTVVSPSVVSSGGRRTSSLASAAPNTPSPESLISLSAGVWGLTECCLAGRVVAVQLLLLSSAFFTSLSLCFEVSVDCSGCSTLTLLCAVAVSLPPLHTVWDSVGPPCCCVELDLHVGVFDRSETGDKVFETSDVTSPPSEALACLTEGLS